MIEEKITQISEFGGTYQGMSQTGREGNNLTLVFTRGGGDDPIETLMVEIAHVEDEDVTLAVT